MSKDNGQQHFNQLTPAEAERLSLLLEEMGEAIQVIGKIQRHGYESVNPFDSSKTRNRELLENELGHVLHAATRMFGAGDIGRRSVGAAEYDKSTRIGKYLHHQELPKG